jgi:sterol desaturase/sphingolipid hydroxylase (fatty acid hydroxylase superfamily)
LDWQKDFSQWFDRFITPVDDPGSRLFHLNLSISLLFILIWVLISFKDITFRQAILKTKRLVFRKKYWWNRSTKIDYKIYFFNSILKILLFIPFLDFSFRFSQWTVKALLKMNQGQMGGMSASTLNIFLFTVFAFCFDDFLRFFHHLLMHKIPWLWRLHVTHHSARVLTPISLYRTHPLESAMATVRNSLSTGVMIGLFIFLFQSKFNLFTVFGVNFFGFSFNFLASNLRHSHIPITFGFMEKIFISPKQHQVHHSTDPSHYDKNFGVSLTIWDQVNRSLIYSKDVKTPLKFGLNGGVKHQSFRRLIFKP